MPAEPIVAPSHSRPHAVDRQIECGESMLRLHRGAIALRSRISQAPPSARLLLGSDPEIGEKLPPHSTGWFLLEVDH